MQMKDRLAGLGAVVEDQTVACGVQASNAGHLGGHPDQVSNEPFFCPVHPVRRTQMFLGQDEKVHRSLGRTIRDNDAIRILMQPWGRDSAGCDPAKNAIFRGQGNL